MIKSHFHNKILIFLALLCVVMLLLSIVAQNFLHLRLCNLCLYQRYLIAASAFIAIAGIVFLELPAYTVLTALSVLFLTNLCFSSYQFALESGWIEASIFCKSSVNLLKVSSMAELKKTLIDESFESCSKPDSVLFGMSMAFYSIKASLILLALSLYGLVIEYKNSHAKT